MGRWLSRAAAGALAATVTIGTAVLGAAPAHADGPAGVASPAPPVATPTARAAAHARPAIVRVVVSFSGYVVDEKGQTLHGNQAFTGQLTCTGFGVDPSGYIATAGHCGDGTTAEGISGDLIQAAAAEVAAANPALPPDAVLAEAAKWRTHGSTDTSPVDMVFKVVTGSTEAGPAPQLRPAQLVADRPLLQGDVALLKIDATNLPTLQLASDDDAAIGTPLLAIGFPGAVDATTDFTDEPSNKDGQVSSHKTVDGVPFFEISAALGHGMSGGPTVDMQGRVLGLNSWGLDTQQINFIAPASGLAALMKEKGVKGDPGPDDLLFRSALDDFYAGRYSAAIGELDTLLAADSTHAQAIQLRAKAVDDRQRFGDAPVAAPAGSDLPYGLTPLSFYGGIGGAALVLVLLVWLVVAARRRASRRASAAAAVVPATPPWGLVPTGRLPRPDGRPLPFATMQAPVALMTRPDVACPRCGSALHDGLAAFCHTCAMPRPR